ncbi:luciferin 4-monooxygenase-like [Atheta coriaria]|uniref:luciferin 4-monooxygenase-like n=1 Tax=Dalotia coriaria TaxID=877792 RepID=UPI0031F42C11
MVPVSDKSKIVRGLPLDNPISEESLGVQFYQRLLKRNDSPAMINVVTNESLSFRDMFVMTCKFAEWLRRQGLVENDVILMCCGNVLEYFIPVIAAMYSCIVVANGNPIYTEREIQHAIDLAKPKLIICVKANYDKFVNIKNNIKVIVIEDIYKLIETINIDPLTFVPKSCNVYDQTAVILFSSGTSGLFKAVMLTHRNYNALFNQSENPRLSATTGSSVILFLPFFHVYGFAQVMANHFLGNCLHFMHKFEVASLLAAIEKHKISTLPVVPPVVIILSKTPLASKYNLTSVHTIICGAAPLSAETEAAILKVFKTQISVKVTVSLKQHSLQLCFTLKI